MTPDEFRKAALSLEGASEGSHHATADFRVNGRLHHDLRRAGGAPGRWRIRMDKPKARARKG